MLAATLPSAQVKAGELDFSYGFTASEAISDNIDLAPPGEEETGFISNLVGHARLRSTSARVRANYDGSATLKMQSGGDDEGLSVLPQLRGLGNVEAIEDFFFIDTASSVSQQVLSSRAGDSESNRKTVQTHRISPYVVNRFGGFASSEVRYTYNRVETDKGAAGTGAIGDNRISPTTETQSVRAALNSGVDFNRLRWGIAANASESDRSNGSNITRESATLDTEYTVARGYSVLGSLGYERLEEDQDAGAGSSTGTNDFSGPTWRVGFRWEPNRRLNLRATYGVRDNDENLDANLSYDLGARTKLTLSYAERLETGEERLVRNLSLIGEDPETGELIDLSTGLPFDPSTGPTSVIRDITRTRSFRANLSATRGRNTYRAGAIYEAQREENVPVFIANDETNIGVNGGWTRRLNPRTNFNLNGSLLTTNFENENREDTEYNINTRLSYNVFTNVNAFANYSYRQQNSDLDSAEYTENRIMFGASANF